MSVVTRARGTAVLILVCALLAGCGGSGAPSAGSPSATQAAQGAQLAAGLRRWGVSMRSAMNGITVLFSRPDAVRAIEAGAPRTLARLRRYEATLVTCSAVVRRLGTAPPSLAIARLEALHACKTIELGGRLVGAGVRQVSGGQGFDVLDRASSVLASGDDGVRRALIDLAPVR